MLQKFTLSFGLWRSKMRARAGAFHIVGKARHFVVDDTKEFISGKAELYRALSKVVTWRAIGKA